MTNSRNGQASFSRAVESLEEKRAEIDLHIDRLIETGAVDAANGAAIDGLIDAWLAQELQGLEIDVRRRKAEISRELDELTTRRAALLATLGRVEGEVAAAQRTLFESTINLTSPSITSHGEVGSR